VRRQSVDPVDLFHAHVGGIDTCARALLAAERILQDGRLAAAVRDRYAGWRGPLGQEILKGEVGLDGLAARVLERDRDVAPASGRQELLENLLGRFC
jgi:xylose isomerase